MISLKNIAMAATNKKEYERGLDYYDQRKVSNLQIKQDRNNGHTQISADVQGRYNYGVEVTLNKNGEILSHFCDCPAFYSYEGCCKHIIAVLLQYYYRRILKNDSYDGESSGADVLTDSYSRNMINKYSDKMINSAVASASQKKVKLVPRLEFDRFGRLSLGLSVGNGRMYVIKDINKFYSDMNLGNVVKYGEKLTLLHEINSFEQNSRPLLHFVMNKCAEFYVYNSGDILRARVDKKCLFLSPKAFDELFDIYMGQRVYISLGGYDRSGIELFDGNPEIGLSIKKEGRAYTLSLKPSPRLFIKGESRAYVLIDCRLSRCTEEFSTATLPIFSAFTEKGGNLIIGSNDMGPFCSNVLATIENFIKIDTSLDLSSFYPADLSIKLFIDMPKKNLVTGKLEYCYGDVIIGPMESEKKVPFQRDVKKELLAQSLINKYFEAYDPDRLFFFNENEEKVFTLFSDGLEEMGGVMEIYTSDSIKKITIKRPPSIQIGVKLHGDLINLEFKTGDFPQEELAGLLSSYRLHKKYHKLKDGSFIDLRNSPLSSVSQLAKGLSLKNHELESGKAEVPKYRAMYIDGMLKENSQLEADRNTDFKSLVRDIHEVGDSDIKPPESLRHILRNYQKTGFRWLKTMSRYGFGGILADDMGLGKTLEAIAFLLSGKEEGIDMPSLIVCPTSLVLNWENEIHRFAPSLSTVSIFGNASQRELQIKDIPGHDIAITSYDMLKRDVELYSGFEFYCEIVDEAQYIKNAGTQNAQAVKQIRSGQRFALTGTPVENSLGEVWSIFDFLMPGYLYSHNSFKNEFEIPIIKDKDESSVTSLKKMLSPFILRRLKKNVLKELPPKTETVLYASLEGEQEKLYKATLMNIRSQLPGNLKPENGGNRMIILSMLTRLRQICCDPALCYENYSGPSTKLSLCLDLLESSAAAGHKVLLFSQFTSMLSIIESHLKKSGLSYYVLKGSTSKEERAALTSRFNTDGTDVFLISLKAGGTGLNLTGADIVIHYDPWWNISAQNQATDRAHRIGQRNAVQVYKLIAKDTIEEKILELQENKMRLADSVITEGGDTISHMTKDELMGLFS